MKEIFSSAALSFLEEPNYMVLGTISRGGVPHLTVVWFAYHDGMLKISITKERVKYKNILRDPRVACVIEDRNNHYRYLQIRGKVVDIEEDPEYVFGDFLCERYERDPNYRYDPVRKKEGRITVSIRPEGYYAKGL